MIKNIHSEGFKKIEKKKLVSIIIAAILLLGLVFFVRHDFDSSGERPYTGDSDNFNGTKIMKDITYKQKIVSKGVIYQLTGYFDSKEKGSLIKIEVMNETENKKIYESTFDTSEISGNGMIEMKLQEELKNGDEASITITGIDGVSEDSIAPILCNDGQLNNVKLGDEEIRGHLAISMHYTGKFRVGYYMFAIIALLIIMLLLFSSYLSQIEPEKILVTLVLIFGIMFAFINPPLQNPDEHYHFQKSIDVSYGNLSPFYLNTDDNIYMLTGPKSIMQSKKHEIYAYTMESDLYKQKYADMSMNEETVSVESIGGFHPFVAYIPQAIAVLIARILHFNVLNTLYLVRIVNVLLFAFIVYWAIKITPIGKHILMAISLTPIVVSQVASASTDGLCNALVFLFFAFIFRYIFTEKEDFGIKEMLPLAGILILLAFCKYLYAVIGILVFLIPMKKFASSKKYWKTFLTIALPMIALFLIYYTFIAGNLIDNSTYNKGVNPGEQLAFAFSNVKYMILVFLNTMNNMLLSYMEQFNTLGSLNFRLDLLVVIVPVFLIGVALTDTSKQYQINKKQRIMILLTAGIIVALVMFSMYLVWTKVGYGIIDGVQARYFIPALPILFLGLQVPNIQNNNKCYTTKVAAGSVFCLFLAIVYMVKMCY